MAMAAATSAAVRGADAAVINVIDGISMEVFGMVASGDTLHQTG
jgi:hypothetical protein